MLINQKIYIHYLSNTENTMRGRWSRGMIPRLQRGDQEFESPPAHSLQKLVFDR